MHEYSTAGTVTTPYKGWNEIRKNLVKQIVILKNDIEYKTEEIKDKTEELDQMERNLDNDDLFMYAFGETSPDRTCLSSHYSRPLSFEDSESGVDYE